MKRVVFAEPAEHDLNAIIEYIALDRPGRLDGTRELSVARLPYLIVYEAAVETVTILAVFHTSRDLARALIERASESKPPPGRRR